MAEQPSSDRFSFSGIEIKTAAVVLALTLVAVKLLTLVIKKQQKLPPGPWGLPLVGYLPFFNKEPHVTFNKLRKTYGDIFLVRMGSCPAVVINGPTLIKEALVTKRDEFSGRPDFITARMIDRGRSLGIGPFGEIWKLHKAVVLKVLSKFTSTCKPLMEDIIRTEALNVVKDFTAHGKNGFSPKDSVLIAVSSMMYQFCYGKNQNIREDKNFIAVTTDEENIALFKKGNILDFMPWLRYLLPHKIRQYKKFISGIEERRITKVEEHEATFDETNLRDITYGLIHAGNTLSADMRAVGLDKERLLESLDVLKRAHGTVASALEWLILMMAAYPEVQDKVFQEIDDIVGQDQLPRLTDRNKLHYTEATITEVMRFGAATPLAVPHAATCDTRLQGFDIPKDTVVMVNLHSIYMDDDLWGDPANFRPERFLDSDGQLDRELAERVCPFSFGRRRCAGERLVDVELFLFFATLMQGVRLYKPTEQPAYTLDGYYIPTRRPDPFKVCSVTRKATSN